MFQCFEHSASYGGGREVGSQEKLLKPRFLEATQDPVVGF